MAQVAGGTRGEDTAIIILAAGHGTRMKSAVPKMLHTVGGLPVLGHVLAAAKTLSPRSISIITGPHAPAVGDVACAIEPGTETFIQDPPQGTADAVKQALPHLASLADSESTGSLGHVFVLNGDTPFIASETLAAMQQALSGGASVVVLGFEAAEPGNYGRLKTNAAGDLQSIIEAKDASPEELEISLCNAGVMAFAVDTLISELPKISNDNAKGEYYLTDMVALANAAGGRCEVMSCTEDEVMGIDARSDLAVAEAVFQHRKRADMMAAGVTLRDPSTVYFSHDTRIEQDVEIGPHVVIGQKVTIASGTVIHPFSHIEHADIAGDAAIGPYARLRPGTQIGQGAKVGNFVEIKKATLEAGAKVNHLSYIGDACVGAGANIGAGTITCNYDGYDKFETNIGAGAFIGSNASLVAPVTIGDGAYVGSGSVVTEDVPADALAVARGRQAEKPGWALKFRARKGPIK